jgi:polyhydroxyalkanoate synthesis regulator phasin
MPGFGDMMQKAFYLGVGLASYASEQASGRFSELQERAQKLADELVARGEMTAEEARRFVDDVMQQGKENAAQAMDQATKAAAQADRAASSTDRDAKPPADIPKGPRRIEILDDDEEPTPTTTAESVTETVADTARPSESPPINAETSIGDLHSQVAALKEELKRLRRDR